METNPSETLYIGLDESNHAGKNKKGEIVVAYMSPFHEDSIVRDYPNRREDFDEFRLSYPYDYRFTILTGERFRFRASSSNLLEVAPTLIHQLVSRDTKCLKVYFDGRLERGSRQMIREEFSEIPEVVVDNFTKKNINSNGNVRKGPRCPYVVYLADSLANHLLYQPTLNLLSHEKFVPYRA